MAETLDPVTDAAPGSSPDPTQDGVLYVTSSADMTSWSTVAEDVIRRFVLPVVCLLGILGLVLTLVVLTHRTMRTSTNCYLTALSVVDLLFLLLLATILTDIHEAFDSSNVAQFILFLYAVYAGIVMHVLLMVSVWLTVVLAIERYVAICLPFLATSLCTINKARIVIVTVTCLAMLCRLPNFWEKQIVGHYENATGVVQYSVEDTRLSLDETYMAVYPVVVDGILASIVPFVMLLLLNVLLMVEVRRSTRYLSRNVRGSYATAEREEHQVTVMLVSIIMVAFVCQAPYVVYTAINSITKFTHVSSLFRVFRQVTILLLTLKSALNFVVYCWSREKFWMTLRSFFCARCAPRPAQLRWSQSGSYYSLQVHSTCIVQPGTAL